MDPELSRRGFASGLALAVALGGSVAGGLDVLAAAIINSVSPTVVLKAIASGLLGPAAFKGGVKVALLGLGLQVAMSIAIAAVYCIAASRLGWLARRPQLGGGIFGVAVFVVMNFVVVPLSKASSNLVLTPCGMAPDLAAMIVFGLVVAYAPRMLAALQRL